MRTLNVEKPKKQKFVKTRQLLACTLLTAGLMFGSGCKERVKEQPVVKQEKQEVIQEQNIDLKLITTLSQFKINQKGNLEIELEKGKPLKFPIHPQLVLRDRRRENRVNDDYEITLLDSNEEECKIKVKKTNVRNVPQKDGTELLDLSNSKDEVLTIKKGEITTLLTDVYEIEGRRNLQVKYLGENKFEISFKDELGEHVPFLGDKDLDLHGGFYVDGERVENGTKGRVGAFHTLTNSYVKGEDEVLLTKQDIKIYEPLEFNFEFIFKMSVEQKRVYIQDWLKRNGTINMLGEKFKVDYLITDEKLNSERKLDYLSGVFVLTHIETGQEVYVSRMEYLVRNRGRTLKESKTNSHEGKMYPSIVKVNDKDYIFSFKKDEEDSISGFSIELIQ